MDWVGIGAVAELTGGRMDVDEARNYWLFSPYVRRFETGKCGPDEFCQGIVSDLRLPISPVEFRERFLSWDRGPLPGALELLNSLRGRFTLACLSNNNPLHWERLKRPDRFGCRFDHLFLSFETGFMKPDSTAYQHVLSRLGCWPEEVIFFDDTPECVEGARTAGIRAYQTRGVESVKEALRQVGILE